MSWHDFKCRLTKHPYTKHRKTWILRHGPVPVGMCVCHRCDEPKCWEIEHLFLGTAKQNTADALRKGRFEFHPENLTRTPHTQGARNGNAKLTEEQVRAIRQQPERAGVDIAYEFGVTPTCVSFARRGRTWRHV